MYLEGILILERRGYGRGQSQSTKVAKTKTTHRHHPHTSVILAYVRTCSGTHIVVLSFVLKGKVDGKKVAVVGL
jgi:hypothetical protein